MKQKSFKTYFTSFSKRPPEPPLNDLTMIENIMRDDIFHITLDWQTGKELSSAARQAFDLLNENRNMNEFSHATAMAAFDEMCAVEASR